MEMSFIIIEMVKNLLKNTGIRESKLENGNIITKMVS